MDPANLQAQKMRQAPAAPRRYDGTNGNPLYDPSNGGHYGTSALFFLPQYLAHTFISFYFALFYGPEDAMNS